jgi:hypothetical protein
MLRRAPLAIILVCILTLAIIGLGWQMFFFGIGRGARQVLDNPLVSEAREYWGDPSKTEAKGPDH